MLALYSSGRLVRVFADAREGAGGQSDASSSFLWRVCKGICSCQRGGLSQRSVRGGG